MSHQVRLGQCFMVASRWSQKLCTSLPFGPKLEIRERRYLFSVLNLVHLDL